MKRARCNACGRKRPIKHLRRTDPLSEEVQWDVCCRNDSACTLAHDRWVARDFRRILGYESNANGLLFSVMKYAKAHRRSGRRGIYGFRHC